MSTQAHQVIRHAQHDVGATCHASMRPASRRQATPALADAMTLHDDQRRLLDRLIDAARRLPHPLRNEALVCLLVGTGLTPIEIAMLRVRDYLTEGGHVRVLSRVEPAIAYNGRARPLLFVNRRVCQAVDHYLDERRNSAEPGGQPGRFRGLPPDAALILANDGKPLRVVHRRDGQRTQRICAPMHALCRTIFAAAQITDVTARDGKRLFARALYALGADIDGIRVLCGLSGRRGARRLLNVPRHPETEALRISGLVSRLL